MFKSNDAGSMNILSEELERKIAEVNSSMVSARDQAEKYQENKNKLEVEIRDLETVHKKLSEEIIVLKETEKTVLFGLGEVRERTSQQRAELAELEKQTQEIKMANEEEAKKFAAERAELEKQKEELDSQEKVMRTFSKGLEEKEKKLDIYGEHIKKVLDSLKSG